VLTHLVSIAPWYLVITRFKFSAIFLRLCADQYRHPDEMYKVFNAWFYRDHWLGTIRNSIRVLHGRTMTHSHRHDCRGGKRNSGRVPAVRDRRRSVF